MARLPVTALMTMLVALPSFAQELPETAIWLLEIHDGVPGEPERISRSDGYNNQPWFSPDGKALYFTSEQHDGQTDIMRHDLVSGEQVLIHPSLESEFSPLPIPGQNALSVVRIELPDGRQRLWKLPLDRGEPELLLPDIEPVGYHAWLEEDTVALFILGETFDLHLAHISEAGSRQVIENIGRTLRRHPVTGHALFVDKNLEPWSIADLNPESGVVSTILPLLPGIEDFEVDSLGRYWAGVESKLYIGNDCSNGWTLVADFREYGIMEITRLAVQANGNKIATVSTWSADYFSTE